MNVNTSQNDTGVVEGDFKSCHLVWEENNSILHTTKLIPVKFAKQGKIIEVQNDDKSWSSWMVLVASENVITNPTDPKVLIKSHRKATGDSMPRTK